MGIKDCEPKPQQLKFSVGTRQLLSKAEESAISLNHNYIGTEHILLASLKDPLVAGFTKTFPNGDPEGIRNSVLFIVGQGERPVKRVCGLTPRAKHVIELAVDEAKSQGKTQIEPSDVLIGLVREGEGVAAGILFDICKISFDNVGVVRKYFEDLSENSKLPHKIKIVMQDLQRKMEDPSLTVKQKKSLLAKVETAIRLTQSPQQKTQKKS